MESIWHSNGSQTCIDTSFSNYYCYYYHARIQMVHVCLNCLAIDKFSVCVNQENSVKLKLNEMIIYPILKYTFEQLTSFIASPKSNDWRLKRYQIWTWICRFLGKLVKRDHSLQFAPIKGCLVFFSFKKERGRLIKAKFCRILSKILKIVKTFTGFM